MSEQSERAADVSVRVPPETHRDLLTIQYSRRMATGELLSLGEIIRQAVKGLLAGQPVQP